MKYFVLTGVIILYFILVLFALLERYFENNDETGVEDEFE